MANPYDILQYLPLKCKTQDEENYINFLWEAFELNYENGKYQFAFIAYHLLFMTFVYFQIWKIYAVHSDDFRKSILGFRKIDELLETLDERNHRNRTSGNPIEQFYPFSFSEENERTIMTFFRLIGCDKTKIGRYKKIVNDRNEIAHANGKMVFVSSVDIDSKIDEIMMLVEEIHSHSCDTARKCLFDFLINNFDPADREYDDDLDQLDEILVRGNYISPKDITNLMGCNLDHLTANENIPDMCILFDKFKAEYAEQGA